MDTKYDQNMILLALDTGTQTSERKLRHGKLKLSGADLDLVAKDIIV
jgi:hypothetical protein